MYNTFWFAVYMLTLSTQNSQAVKKSAALYKMASMKKVVKYRWQPRNVGGGKSVIKIPSQPFLGCHAPVFCNFFYISHFALGHTLFYSLAVFK